MKHMLVNQSATINASIEEVYAVITDYEVGHRAILPEPYFKSMDILKGGQGEGTEILVKMEVFGQAFSYHQVVSEPVKGRQIIERDINTGLASSFFLEPINNEETTVRIEAEIALSGGFQSVLERMFNPLIIGDIFKKELQNLETYITRKQIAKIS